MFDPSLARARVERLWNLAAQFGAERGSNRVYLDEIVSDRLQLVAGLQVLRDELLFAQPRGGGDVERAQADFSLPSVVTTQAVTNCGDRIHQSELERYTQVVASRFASLSEVGALKPEAFHPAGGGTDNGATLAHVTWAHVLDERLRALVYQGHPGSFVMCGFDLKTHCGRIDGPGGELAFGRGQESAWRQPRASCGAIMGTLMSYDETNGVHRRIRKDLGEASYRHLQAGVRTEDGVDITAVVAAAIVAVQGMRDTAEALKSELDERGLGHLTASITINRAGMPDTIIYLARATVFDGELAVQGMGTDATFYGGHVERRGHEPRLVLTYGGTAGDALPVVKEPYAVRRAAVPEDLYVW